MLIKDNAFRIGDTKFMLTKTGKALIKNVVTDPATGGTYLDTAYAKPEQVIGFQARAVGGAHPRRAFPRQVERVEIGAAAQHRLFGKLLHHLARSVIDHLIDDRGGVAVDHDLMRHRTRHDVGIDVHGAPASAAVTLSLGGSSVATACSPLSLIG